MKTQNIYTERGRNDTKKRIPTFMGTRKRFFTVSWILSSIFNVKGTSNGMNFYLKITINASQHVCIFFEYNLPISVFPTTIRALGYSDFSSKRSKSDVGLYHVVFLPLNISCSLSNSHESCIYNQIVLAHEMRY